ncbi:MAG: hypothetical protein K2G08_08670 [Paramuribaculum sp.]|nr:hypothetical protein [Bacteroides sp.]MDE6038425.1 hypothetical protein [Paramuribaculum sp.]MDE6051741.1 hypothetical protein [Paramuribaculum sp.]
MNKTTKIIIGVAAALAVILLGIIFFLSKTVSDQKKANIDAQTQIEQLKLDYDNLSLENELTDLNNQFEMHENAAIRLENDSILAKYNASKARVEELMKQLKEQKDANRATQAELDKLRTEIASLRGLLRHYVAMVDSLGKENQALRTENEEVKGRNEQLASQVESVSRDRDILQDKMTLAEKLNVTGVNLTALNKKGKNEKNVTKATQLMVTFTIPQNNSTPVGAKTIYLRITSPEGSLLGSGGSFKFENTSLQCTAKKTIEYSGDEISGIAIYWDVNTTLNPGEYTVELFADNYRLTSRRFTLKK